MTQRREGEGRGRPSPDHVRVVKAGGDAIHEHAGEDPEETARVALRAMLRAAGVTEYGSIDASRGAGPGEAVRLRSITMRGQVALLDAAFPEPEDAGGQFRMNVEAGP